MNERTSVPSRRRLAGVAISKMIAMMVVLLAPLCATIVGVLAVTPGTAFADNEVTASEPENGAVLATSPEQIVFTFTEEVGELRLVTVECNGDAITLPPPTLSGNARMMTTEIPDALPKGLCVATWNVSNTDNETNGTSQISFTIESEPTPTTLPEEADTDASQTAAQTNGGTLIPAAGAADDAEPDGTDAVDATADPAADDGVVVDTIDLARVESGQGPLWLGRLLSTLGIAVVFGSLIVIASAWPEGVEYLITVRFLRGAWLLALLGTVLFVAAAAAAVTSESLGAGFSPAAWLDLLDAGWAGRAALLRLVFVIAAAWAAFRPDRVIDPVTQVVALGIPALSVVTIGIGRADGRLALLGVFIGVIHALAMAVWVGGVILLARVVLAGPGDEDLVHATRGFSRVSVSAIAITIVTGLAQMFRLDGGQLFGNGHGLFTVLKVVLVAAMLFIGLSARQFAQQRLTRAHEMTVPMADRLRRAFGMEAAIGLVTLMASSWLLALDPIHVDTEPKIDYAIERQITFEDETETALLDVTVKLTNDQVGRSGLEVRVDTPAEGITGLEVTFTPPPNEQIESIVQGVPLEGSGRAVRTEANGLPLDIAGNWQIQVTAQTAAGVITTEPVEFPIKTADGTDPSTSITAPEQIIVTIPPNSEP